MLENNIKMNLKEIECEVVTRLKWLRLWSSSLFLNTEINVRVPYKARNFLAS
jgi:hypothetical protein